MEWIGEKEAKAAAKKGKEAALDCSIEHWKQLSHRPKSVIKALIADKTEVYADSCALCNLYRYQSRLCCNKCLADTENGCCSDLWWKAAILIERPIRKQSAAKFTKAAKKVYEFLKGRKK